MIIFLVKDTTVGQEVLTARMGVVFFFGGSSRKPRKPLFVLG